MDHTLVIKLTSENGSGVPIGLIESPPMLWLTLKARNPGFSWSSTAVASEVEQFGYGLWEWVEEPSVIRYTKETYIKSYRQDGITKHSDNVWRNTFTEVDATEEEKAERTNMEKELKIRERNQALRFSDFTQVEDAPNYIKAKQSEWNIYRQALRDLPTQEGFPWIDLPIKPSK